LRGFFLTGGWCRKFQSPTIAVNDWGDFHSLGEKTNPKERTLCHKMFEYCLPGEVGKRRKEVEVVQGGTKGKGGGNPLFIERGKGRTDSAFALIREGERVRRRKKGQAVRVKEEEQGATHFMGRFQKIFPLTNGENQKLSCPRRGGSGFWGKLQWMGYNQQQRGRMSTESDLTKGTPPFCGSTTKSPAGRRHRWETIKGGGRGRCNFCVPKELPINEKLVSLQDRAGWVHREGTKWQMGEKPAIPTSVRPHSRKGGERIWPRKNLNHNTGRLATGA